MENATPTMLTYIEETPAQVALNVERAAEPVSYTHLTLPTT